EVLDLVTATGALLDLARERVDRNAVVRILRNRDIHLERGLRMRGQRSDRKTRGNNGKQPAGERHNRISINLGSAARAVRVCRVRSGRILAAPVPRPIGMK